VPHTDVAIIGAGPYGLSLASHLQARRIEFRIFGTPMQLWRRMLPGMCLKSLDFATNIYTPRSSYSLRDYCKARGLSSAEPLPISRFAEYGMWVQKQLLPQVEDVQVTHLAKANGGFELALGNGERLSARRAVVAVGLSYFARMPRELGEIPRELASHTSHHSQLSGFGGKNVAVIGAGQSALEAAALLHEGGANVEIVVRGSGVYFADPPAAVRSFSQRVLHPTSVLGPGRLNWFLEHFPLAMHYAPQERRVRLTRKHLGPWGAWWLKDRVVGKIPVRPFTRIRGARVLGSRVALRISENGADERELPFDHVVCGTGYESDVDRLTFLDSGVMASVRRIERAPALSRNFESSVPGLHFIGQASAFSFGPLFRFVAGAAYTAPALAKTLAVRLGKPARATVSSPDPSPA
jgi:cation diffusion facilitator CzcD-associated flavoprotein CzcO